MLHAFGLGDEQRRKTRPYRRLEIGDGESQRPVDADRHVGAALRHLLHGLGQHFARLGLLGQGHAVLEIDQHAVGAALMRLVDEFGYVARDIEDRAPDGWGRSGGGGSVHFFFPLEIAPALQSLSYSASPNSGFNNASLCSPILGAALLSAPGVPERRGTTGCVGSSPISSSGISISASRSRTQVALTIWAMS